MRMAVVNVWPVHMETRLWYDGRYYGEDPSSGFHPSLDDSNNEDSPIVNRSTIREDPSSGIRRLKG
jgi:hypothetical protein